MKQFGTFSSILPEEHDENDAFFHIKKQTNSYQTHEDTQKHKKNKHFQKMGD